jgi:hypothetical protein
LSEQGNEAELLCELRLGAERFQISRPTKTTTYDLVAEKEGRCFRVQVKSTAALKESGKGGAYELTCRRNRGHTSMVAYEDNDFDFLCAYVKPLNTWYVIPIGEIRATKLCLYPHRENQEGFYERYKERWDLIGG